MPRPALSNTASAALLSLSAFAIFSIHDVIIKQLGGSYSVFQIIFFTSLISFPLLTLALIRERQESTLRPKHPYWMALRCGCGTVSGACAFAAIGALPLSEVYAYIFATPLIITVLAIPVLGEKVRLHRGLAVVVGLIGVLIVLQPGTTALTAGHVAALGAAFAGAMVSLITRKIGREERGVVMLLYPMMTNLVVTAMILPLVYVPVPLGDLGLLAVDAVLVLSAMSVLVAAYVRASAMTVAPMQYSQIIWATVFGLFLFDEYPEWQTYLGTAIIALSGVYVLLREGQVSDNQPVSRTRTRPGLNNGFRISQALKRRKKG